MVTIIRNNIVLLLPIGARISLELKIIHDNIYAHATAVYKTNYYDMHLTQHYNGIVYRYKFFNRHIILAYVKRPSYNLLPLPRYLYKVR